MKKMYVIVEAPSAHRLDLSRIIECNADIDEALRMVERMGAKKIDFQFNFNLDDDEEMCKIVGSAQEIFPAGSVLQMGRIIDPVFGPDGTAIAI